MPRSASAAGSFRNATRCSAPRGSPRASARAAALASESMRETIAVPGDGSQSARNRASVVISVFAKVTSGDVFHTYSCFARGLDMMNGAYQFLDLVPKGRDEESLPFTMAWVRLRDQYE